MYLLVRNESDIISPSSSDSNIEKLMLLPLKSAASTASASRFRFYISAFNMLVETLRGRAIALLNHRRQL